MSLCFLRDYSSLVADIEQQFRVTDWRSGDVDIWPLARLDLYLDMYRQETGDVAAAQSLLRRMAGSIARPLVNRWKTWGDRAHHLTRPVAANAIFLGDGVSLDRIDGLWRDRFGEPVMAALEEQGRDIFLMQNGDLSRLPWKRPTFPANRIEARGWLAALPRPAALPDHAQALNFLRRRGVAAPSLEFRALSRRAAIVASTACGFEGVLKRVRPKLAFVIAYYANSAPAFMLACRRQGVLGVDVQHAPLAGAPMAYRWSALPARGYSTLPAVFWSWSAEDARGIQDSCGTNLWHRGLHGGHPQLAAFMQQRETWDAKYRTLAGANVFEREILVALQPLAGHGADWEALAAQIEAAPPQWRWWIRRHPASRPHQDAAFGRLLSLARPNVLVEPASALPLPVLLSHMSVLLSLASGAAEEASLFGVPALFLDEAAAVPFAELIVAGRARIINVGKTVSAVAALPVKAGRQLPPQPSPGKTIAELDEMATAYAAMCSAAKR